MSENFDADDSFTSELKRQKKKARLPFLGEGRKMEEAIWTQHFKDSRTINTRKMSDGPGTPELSSTTPQRL